MSAIPSREVTSAQVSAISFGFYSDDEIRALSVKQIVSPIVFDNLRNAVPGGLYDPAMGPLEAQGQCATCKQGYMSCPGHFGHIELAVPVYNPLVFTTMYKLLRCTCLNCFKLKMLEAEVEQYRTKLELLTEGRLVEAMQIMTGGNSNTAKAMQKMQGDMSEGGVDLMDIDPKEAGAEQARLAAKLAGAGDSDAAERRRSHAAASTSTGSSKRDNMTSLSLEAFRETVGEFFKRMPIRQCANCNAHTPDLKRDGCTKIFQKPLEWKKLEKNRSRGIDITSALKSSGTNEVEIMEAELAKELDREAQAAERQGEDLVDGGGGQALVSTQSEVIKAPAEGASAAQRPRFMTVSEVREVMRRMWAKNSDILSLMYAQDSRLRLFGFGAGSGGRAAPSAPTFAAAYRMFFLQVVPVAPNRVRPPSFIGDNTFEHPHNIALTRIINANLELVSRAVEPAAAAEVIEENRALLRQLDLAASLRTWLALQGHVNSLLDSTTAGPAAKGDVQGIRQQLEKKEGLFRKNMMGKRVNFAARSVISPDPYLAAGEIGVPPYFAVRLSFPERVTPWNVAELREMVIRGAYEHPGAVAVEDELGRVILLHKLPLNRREAVAKLLLSKQGGEEGGARGRKLGSPGSGGRGAGKIVYRHLRDGDLLLTNRQPTLHKPGLMAHRARVLKGERVIRMHYANCATFNADFDGDEINLHLPQDNFGRAEGYGIVHADEQYIVPTDGKPVRGLIQDHVVAGVKLTKRDTFLTRSDFMQLVYACCSPARPGLKDTVDLQVPPPAIWKPQPLWTGKQVISSVLAHFTRGMPPLTVRAATKVPADFWGKGGTVHYSLHGHDSEFTFPKSAEGEMLVVKGELVTGVLDKAVFGKFGLVHAVQDLYGNAVAGAFISALSRLLTYYLQMQGFTCGYDDLLLVKKAEQARSALLDTAETAALAASARFVGEEVPQLMQGADGSKPKPQSAIAAEVWEGTRGAIQRALAQRYRSSKEAGAGHDAVATAALHPLGSDVVKVCLPDGQCKPFPVNCLSLMTVSGAKGSNVNFSQISALLGQQELEGRRVPRMASGKTLPCFAPFDPGARSGGFIGDRFLTGLRPQEYYFHCMAGREGLVDTTVKTSRSGYLQRCLIKNLEPLRIHYDHTVRDDCDGSIVQFAYGEDGMDVTARSFMREFGILARNAERFAQQVDPAAAERASRLSGLFDLEQQALRRNRQRQRRLEKGQVNKAGREPPLTADLPLTALGVASEAFQDALATYVRTNPEGTLHSASSPLKKRKKAAEAEAVSAGQLAPRSPEGFAQLMELKFLRGLAAPGEAVGVLAGQSIGEPSTQMTLNTFHMAGRGEANVTLGIPRLRELLMTAAQSIKTPIMTLPLLATCDKDDANALANRLRRLSLAEVVEDIEVEESYVLGNDTGGRGREYKVALRFSDPAKYPPEAHLQYEEVVEVFQGSFLNRLVTALKKEMKKLSASDAFSSISVAKLGGEEGFGRAHGSAGDGEAETAAPRKSEKDEENENEELDAENVEGKLAWQGGRTEEATYEEGDAEDAAISAAARAQAAKEAGDPEDDDEDKEEEGERGLGEQAMAVAEQPAVTGPAKTAKKKGQPLVAAAVQAAARVDTETWTCEAALTVALDAPKILMLKLVEQVAADTVLRATPGIDRCYVVEKKPGEKGPALTVQTDGINFEGAWTNSDIVDASAVTANDVGAVLRTFGVEAARAQLVAEVSAVFGAYGIGVDPRHLSLISDHMTHQGGYQPLNRMGIEGSASPFLKVTFETAAHFLTDATLKGATDDLASPASRIVAGRVVGVGTGSCELIQNLSIGT
ncbi:g7462 [Coccomyxa elongata]